MVIDLPPFLLALGLLLFPRQWLRAGATILRRRRRSGSKPAIVEPWRERESGDPRLSFAREFTQFRNYLDLLRAAAGGLLLFGGMGVEASLSLAAGAPASAGKTLLILRAALLLAGLIAQTIRIEHRRVTFYPPVFYLAGLSLALCGWKVALFAFALIWTFNAALGNAQAFLTIYAVLIAGFGFLFVGIRKPWVIYAALLAFLPVLLSLLLARPLQILTRKGSRVGRG